MDQELQKLIARLQDQKCPPAVLDCVMHRISRDKTQARPRRLFFAWAVAVACIFTIAVAWQWQARREAEHVAAEHAAQTRAERDLVLQQTHQAFGYIGQALIRVAAHAENTLSKEAVPPLRNSFETVKNKVTNPI